YSSHCHRQLSYLHCCPTRRSSDLMDNLESMAEQAPQELALISQDQLSRLLDNVGSELVSYGATLVSLSGVAGVVSLLVFLVLIPVLVFFFLKDKHRLMAWFAQYLPRDRALVTHVSHEVNAQIGNYVRGKVLEILIVWI